MDHRNHHALRDKGLFSRRVHFHPQIMDHPSRRFRWTVDNLNLHVGWHPLITKLRQIAVPLRPACLQFMDRQLNIPNLRGGLHHKDNLSLELGSRIGFRTQALQNMGSKNLLPQSTFESSQLRATWVPILTVRQSQRPGRVQRLYLGISNQKIALLRILKTGIQMFPVVYSLLRFHMRRRKRLFPDTPTAAIQIALKRKRTMSRPNRGNLA